MPLIFSQERLRTLRSTIPSNGAHSSQTLSETSHSASGSHSLVLSPLAVRREKRRRMVKMEDRSTAYYMRDTAPREVIDLT